MEIYGKVVSETGAPIKGASVYRMFPTGETYSSVIPSGEGGFFNGRVPDPSFYWVVSAPGYLTKPIPVPEHETDISSAVIVQLEQDPANLIPAPGLQSPGGYSGNLAAAPAAWPVALSIGIGAAAGVAGLWFLGDQRTKVKMRKIFN